MNIVTIKELKNHINLSISEIDSINKVIKLHPMRITPYYLSLINKDDPHDPIRKMAIPSIHELDPSGEFDTSGEQENTKLTGLQHKYKQTALILVTNKCAMYCRHCFRKRLIGLKQEEVLKNFNDAIDYIKLHKEIRNVLISGGDPFVLSTSIIEHFIKSFSGIDHLDFIRFGTRTPVVYPERFSDDRLLELLSNYSNKKRIYISTHFNHPNEITSQSTEVVNKLIRSNVILNNQSILLKGVNDRSHVLAELQSKLSKIGVNPYYVFQCRPVKRVKNNFQVSLVDGYRIVEGAKNLLDGYSKRFRYIMSHKTGKIEIIGIDNKYIYFKYHQAKDPKNMSRFFKKKIDLTATWWNTTHPCTHGESCP